ncbi:MAG: DUF4386 family protein [Beijerinckiaceae bacterium]|nr:DUF4386 family protein [Beijerinckiaceae bacterium]MCZ8300362.1 DUF4386 family protein [Beijerinckiaceae bacterium]
MTPAFPAAPMSRAETLALVSLVLAQVVLFLVPLVVLGGAIGWPASLRLPASEALPLIHRNAVAVQVGYVGYLLTAVAMLPLALAFRRHAQALGVTGLLVDTMAALGIAAAVLKTLGIVRWLIAMPALAALHDGMTDPAIRMMAEVNYLALNGYAGSVGELLGVQLFSGLWLILLGITLRQTGLRFHGIAAVALGLGFTAMAARTLVPAVNALGAVLPPFGLAWYLLLAISLWRQGLSSKI